MGGFLAAVVEQPSGRDLVGGGEPELGVGPLGERARGAGAAHLGRDRSAPDGVGAHSGHSRATANASTTSSSLEST